MALSVRGDNYLHYIGLRSGRKVRVNLNEQGDEHVSFSVLDLAPSPNGRYLLAATDRSRHIMLRTPDAALLAGGSSGGKKKAAGAKAAGAATDDEDGGGGGAASAVRTTRTMHHNDNPVHSHARNFYGHVADEYSQPRVGWSPCGKFVYSTSQADHAIHVWCVASARALSPVAAQHTELVRSLSCVAATPSSSSSSSSSLSPLAEGGAAALIATASYDKSVRIWGRPERRSSVLS